MATKHDLSVLTPYMRCTGCHRAMTLGGIDRNIGCVCGHMEFTQIHAPSLIEKFKCWMLKR